MRANAVRPPGCKYWADAAWAAKGEIMSVTYERFLAEVGVRAGFSSADQSESAARAVIAVLAALVPSALRHDLEEVLPEELAEVVDGSQEVLPPVSNPDAFYSAVASSEHVPVGFAKEHASVVCEGLTDLLPPEFVQRLRSALGQPVARIFQQRNRYAAPPKKSASKACPDDRRTLSSGRPGGKHPLSEARGAADDTTLARGRPGGKRPISEARPGGTRPLSEARPGHRGDSNK